MARLACLRICFHWLDWHVCCSHFPGFGANARIAWHGLVCRSNEAMGRFSLGGGATGRFEPAGRREGRREVFASAFEPMKKACKFGDESRGSLQSKDESQVGPASESDWAHRQRHPVRVKDCARCAFLDVGPQLRQGHGSYKHEVHGERARTVWLTQRPLHFPGLWGVGCTFCAFAAQRLADTRRQMAGDAGALGSTSPP